MFNRTYIKDMAKARLNGGSGNAILVLFLAGLFGGISGSFLEFRFGSEINMDLGHFGAVDKVTFILVLTNKKDAHRRHPACFIIRFRFNAVADKRQWSSAASKPRRKTRAKLCSRFCAENEPSHQTCRSFSASR